MNTEYRKRNTYYIFALLILSVIILRCTVRLSSPYVILIVKTVASFTFIILAVVSYGIKACDKTYYKIMMLAFIFSMAGDVVLEANDMITQVDFFVVGVACFAISHIFYIIAFVKISGFSRFQLITVLVMIVFSVGFLSLAPWFDFGNMYYIIMGYAVVISLMVGSAISLVRLRHINKRAVILTISGAILFYISDIALVHVLYSSFNGIIISDINAFAYYIGQGLLGLSIMNGFQNTNR